MGLEQGSWWGLRSPRLRSPIAQRALSPSEVSVRRWASGYRPAGRGPHRPRPPSSWVVRHSGRPRCLGAASAGPAPELEAASTLREAQPLAGNPQVAGSPPAVARMAQANRASVTMVAPIRAALPGREPPVLAPPVPGRERQPRLSTLAPRQDSLRVLRRVVATRRGWRRGPAVRVSAVRPRARRAVPLRRASTPGPRPSSRDCGSPRPARGETRDRDRPTRGVPCGRETRCGTPR